MKRQTNSALRMEASEWLLRLNDPELDPEEPYTTLEARNAAFMGWVASSAQHLRMFLNVVDAHRRMNTIDPDRLIDLERMLDSQAEVIRLHGKTLTPSPLARTAPSIWRLTFSGGRGRVLVAASVTAVALAAVLYWSALGSNVYTTAVGEQRQAKLEDGSFVYLNTDSKVEIHFNKTERNIRLINGEALFVVQKDSTRPFVVDAGTAKVLAVGTQFNVRRSRAGADVAVIEGVVQVSGTAAPSPALPGGKGEAMFPASRQLKAGEDAHVMKGQVVPGKSNPAVTPDPLAWRERQLVFEEAKLSDVAEEFNRYNTTKIRVVGDFAQNILLTAVFDADRPQGLMLYATKSEALTVEPDGKNWIIRAR